MLTKVLQTLIAKFITLQASIRPQNTGNKAAAVKRPYFAHGWSICFKRDSCIITLVKLVYYL